MWLLYPKSFMQTVYELLKALCICIYGGGSMSEEENNDCNEEQMKKMHEVHKLQVWSTALETGKPPKGF